MAQLLRPLLLVLAALPVCNIPVFRYALERWKPSVYELVVVHRGPLGAPERDVLDRIRAVRANVEIDRVDLDRPLEERWAKVLPALKLQAPYAALVFPGTDDVAWSGPLEAGAVMAALDSPARRETAKRLLSGDSTVWVFLPSGNAAEDEAARALLAAELPKAAARLKLPPRLPSDPPLLSEAPLHLSFPVLEVRRDDPAEAAFVRMLLKTDKDLRGPVVFPIFGRGRALWALAGKGISAENIGEACAFLAGACSCEAKDLNPGVDLVFTVDWDAAMDAPPPAATPAPAPVLLKPRPAAPPAEPAPEPVGGFPVGAALAGAGLLVLITGWRLLAGRRS